jgi:cytoskeletal protein CcmA (bactofilin family)
MVNPPLTKDDVIQITAHTTSTMAERFQYKDSFVASAGQTVFTTTFPYVTGLVDVYVDGFYLSPDDYYATDGTTVNITGFALGGGEKVVIVLGASYPASNSFILSGGTVSGNVSVTGTLGTAQTLSVAQSATVTGNTTIGGWLSVASNSSVGGALTIGSYSTVAANLTVGTNATISGNATIGGNTTIGGTANVTGNVFTSGSITINTDATIRGNTTINGSATISGNMTCGIANVATYIKFPDGTTQVSASGSRATSILIGLIFGG